MTPARRAFRECRMQFPRHCVSLCIHIVGIATFADMIESSLNRIACETASRMCACTHMGPMARTRARHFARGPDTSSVGPTLRAWARHFARGPGGMRVGPMVCAWAAPPRRISRGWRACYGLTRMFSGSRASDTPGQVSLGPSRRPPCPGHPIVSVCYRSGLYCGRHAALRRDLTAPRRGHTALNRDLTALNRDLTAPNRDLTAPRRGLTGSKRGNCASRGRMRDLLADDCAIKWGELHH